MLRPVLQVFTFHGQFIHIRNYKPIEATIKLSLPKFEARRIPEEVYYNEKDIAVLRGLYIM